MKKTGLFNTILLAFILIITFCSCNKKDTKEVVILTVNDMHANLFNFPRFAYIVDSLRNIYPDMLLFSAGDNRTGYAYNDHYPDMPNLPMIELMNKVGFDVGCLGNHEFDGNIEGLRHFINDTDFPVVCANKDFSKIKNLDIPSYIIIENQGLKIGIVGLIETTNNGFPSAHPKNLIDISFSDALETIKDYQFLDTLCDVFVILSHCGFEHDTVMARQFPYCDLIVGGHSHDLVKPATYNNVMITQSAYKLKYCTLIKLTVEDGEVTSKCGKIIKITPSLNENEEVKSMVERYCNNEGFKVVVGKTEKDIKGELTLGAFMTDAQRWMVNADIAFQNYGGIRINNIPEGDISIEQILDLDPFDNEIVTCDMTGRQVRDFIVISSNADKGCTCVSGIKYKMKYDSERKQDKFYDAEVSLNNGSPIQDDKIYKVSMNSYMYSTMKFGHSGNVKETGILTMEADISYLKDKSPVNYSEDDRIIIIEE